jgi:hypothetical protein
LQAEKLIQAASDSFSMRKSAFLRAMYEQINTVRSQNQTGSGFFCNSDVKKTPNAIPLGLTPFCVGGSGENGISEAPRRRVQEQYLSFAGVRLRRAPLLGPALLVIVQNGVNHAQART